MKAKRKRHSAAFKAKVGFEALVGLKTVSQLAREYAVHPTQVTQWRATIRDHMPELFEPGPPGTERWTPKTRPQVKIDFCQSAVDKKEQTYESKTQTA
jgi:transposase-like protein